MMKVGKWEKTIMPALDPGILELGLPTLGICYGFQVMAQQLGGRVAKTGNREYGATTVTLSGVESAITHGQPHTQTVWMSHGDSVVEAPAGFEVLASTETTRRGPGLGPRSCGRPLAQVDRLVDCPRRAQTGGRASLTG